MIWTLRNTDRGIIIEPNEDLYCPICREKLILHDFRVGQHGIKKFYHCDVHMKCPKCSLWLTFGVPISEDEFNMLRSSQLHGKILTDELMFVLNEEDKEKIKERLDSWGYW